MIVARWRLSMERAARAPRLSTPNSVMTTMNRSLILRGEYISVSALLALMPQHARTW